MLNLKNNQTPLEIFGNNNQTTHRTTFRFAKHRFLTGQEGFAALFVTILILAVVFGIGVSIFILTYGEQKIVKNIINSSRAFYAAEAGVEDALLRLEKGMNRTNPYTLNVGDDASVVTSVSDIIGGARTITAEGNALNRIRKTQVVYEISAQKTSFYYGAQIGNGGLVLDDNSNVQGNVFSNGSITASANTQITGTAKVAKNGNNIDGATILTDAYVDICQNSNISGTLTSATKINCTYTSYIPLAEEIATGTFSILQSDINKWKAEALLGGVISSNYNLGGDSVVKLGPKKIEGNMTINDNAQLLVTGTIWVTGTINIKNNAIVKLEQASYGSLSGMIISDGLIILENNSVSSGSGLAGSYLMYISTLNANPAIIIKNNARADILFVSDGWLEIQNNTQLREVSGYGIHLKNNASIKYEVGLQDISFTSGPGGSWDVTNWEEIE